MKTSAPRALALAAAIALTIPAPAVALTEASGVRIQLEVTPGPAGPTTDPEGPSPSDPTGGPSPAGPDGSLPSTGTDGAALALWGAAAVTAAGVALRIRHHRRTGGDVAVAPSPTDPRTTPKE